MIIHSKNLSLSKTFKYNERYIKEGKKLGLECLCNFSGNEKKVSLFFVAAKVLAFSGSKSFSGK
tara:strand:+ start:163 stop:354 length:192 start_codon:yes stop_codon:yes gene_type:complete